MAETINEDKYVRTNSDAPDEEIEFIDILKVLWKWKYLIISGTIVCALAAMVISSVIPNIYQIEMIIKPVILRLDEDTESNPFINTPGNIKALIETRVFKKKILDKLNESGAPDIPKELHLKVALPRNGNFLKITYETPRVEQGIVILKLLVRLIQEEYGDLVEKFQNKIDRGINITKAQIQTISFRKQSYENNIENIDKRVLELESEIMLIGENISLLNKERNKLLLNGKDQSNILSSILLSNTIQQNLQLSNDFKKQIMDLKLIKGTELQRISECEKEHQQQVAEIENLKSTKGNFQIIQIIQKPSSSKYPIKPKKMHILILAIFMGIFAMIFLAFLLEYISRKNAGGV